VAEPLRRVLWHTEVRGSPAQGFVRIQVFIDEVTREVRTEVEYTDYPDIRWVYMPLLP
jgi:hypothetical protein